MNEPTMAELWEGGDPTFKNAVAQIRTERLERLRELGVDTTDPAALERAYDDRETMIRLKGREMFALRDVLGNPPANLDGLAEALKAGRERALAEVRRPRDFLL